MAGVSTPALAAAVSNAGALGSVAVGAMSAEAGRDAILETARLTSQPFGVNLFTHKETAPDPARESAWLMTLAPYFKAFDAEPPKTIQAPYASFVGNDALLDVLLETKPDVISFHFGLPGADQIKALKTIPSLLAVSVTSKEEAQLALEAGMDFIVAQGIEAGGHRGIFGDTDPEIRTFDLLKSCASLGLPVVAAGGLMTGADIKAALAAGAAAAQLGTAFVPCPEASTGDAYRQALLTATEESTAITKAISGRPARGLKNRFMKLESSLLPEYPTAYAAGKALIAAAASKGSTDFSVMWAGTGAHKSRALPAAELVQTLVDEMERAL